MMQRQPRGCRKASANRSRERRARTLRGKYRIGAGGAHTPREENPALSWFRKLRVRHNRMVVDTGLRKSPADCRAGWSQTTSRRCPWLGEAAKGCFQSGRRAAPESGKAGVASDGGHPRGPAHRSVPATGGCVRDGFRLRLRGTCVSAVLQMRDPANKEQFRLRRCCGRNPDGAGEAGRQGR